MGELISTWWRPNFETVMYPYVPPQVATPKECRKIFLTQLPPTGVLGVPKNLKLLAVPLFELYDNAHRYGPVIASLPQLLARVKFVFCDRNAQPLMSDHIGAYELTNIEVHSRLQRRKRQLQQRQQKALALKEAGAGAGALSEGMNASQSQSGNSMEVEEAKQVARHAAVQPALAVGAAGGVRGGVAVNPLLVGNYRAGLEGKLYAQNLLAAQAQAQRQLQIQQLMAAQAHNILRMPPPTMRAPNARVMLTPTMQPQPQGNHAAQFHPAFQHMQHALPQQMQPPQTSQTNPQN